MAGNLLVQMRDGRELTKRQQIQLICTLSMPAILAQISSIVMQYIDAYMVGSLGAQASASIGLVSTSIWLFGGICGAVSSGFSIQAAHCIGAGDTERARSVMRQSFSAACLVSALLVVCGILIADQLPAWLGASPELHRGASQYFTVFVCAIPVVQINRLAGGMLQSSGNMRTPGMLNIMMCMLDVVFNGILIFPSREIMIAGMPVTIPGFGMGVVGAALGTALAQLVTATLMTGYLWFRSDLFRIRRGECWRPERSCICRALRLAMPIGLENVMMCGAMIATTRIVAPLGGGDRCQFICHHGRKPVLYAGLWHSRGSGDSDGTEYRGRTHGSDAPVCPDVRLDRGGDHGADRRRHVCGSPFYDGASDPGGGDPEAGDPDLADRSICGTAVCRFHCGFRRPAGDR